MSLIRGFQQILFPSRCFGCGVLDHELCSQCLLDWRFSDHRTRAADRLVFSSVLYSKTAGHVLLASKEDGIKRADGLVIDALRHSLRNACRKFDMPTILVPIPSSASAVRRRGRNYIEQLTQLIGEDAGIPVSNILLHSRQVADQSILSAEARSKNLVGAMSVVSVPSLARHARPRHPVILVDDLVTTGSTLKEAARALEMGGFSVLTGITAFLAQPLR